MRAPLSPGSLSELQHGDVHFLAVEGKKFDWQTRRALELFEDQKDSIKS